jgi:hypothetical protein
MSSQHKLWIKPRKHKEFTEVTSMEYLMANISWHCDLVCYPTKPESMDVGNGSIIAPIRVDTVLGSTIKQVYTPVLHLVQKEIWDQHAFYKTLTVNPSCPSYQQLLADGLLFLRCKDAIKVSKTIRKSLHKPSV